MKRLITLLTSVLATAMSASPTIANAGILEGSFSGTVTSGADVLNYFGYGAGADLTGQTITGTFTFDPSQFNSVISNAANGTINATGGPLFGGPMMQPPAVIMETINGHTLTSIGDGSSDLFVFQNTPAYLSDTYPNVSATAFGIAVSDITNSYGTIVDYGAANSTTQIISDINNLSTLKFSNIDGTPLYALADGWGGAIFLGDGGGSQILFNVNSESVAPVPTPSTVWLLLTGLGGLLAFGRKRLAVCTAS